MKPHIARYRGVWSCGIYSVAIGSTAIEAWRKWTQFRVAMWSHNGVAHDKTWREYVKGEAAYQKE